MNALIERLQKLCRQLLLLPPGLQITVLMVALVGGRYGWICANRPAHRQEIAAAYGSASIFYGAPQPDHAGNHITFVATSDTGFGFFLGDVATGQKNHVAEQVITKREGEECQLRAWPWLPDDKSFVYSNDRRLFIGDAATGKNAAEITLPTTVTALTWLATNTLVCLGPNGDLYQLEKQLDGTWERSNFSNSRDGGFILRNRMGMATASSEARAESSGADKAFDRTGATDWSSGVTGGSGWVQYQFDVTAWAINRYGLISSTGNADADPRDWELLGSNDGKNWTTLDRRSNEKFTERTQTKTWNLTNTAPYWFYRLNVTATSGGNSGIRLAELQLWSEDSPNLASASSEFPPDESAADAFDGSPFTKWFDHFGPSPSWLAYQFGGGAGWAVSEYALTSANDVPERDPQDWQFQASNDGTNWITLDRRANEPFEARYLTRSFFLTNSTPYRSYRIYMTPGAGGSSQGRQLAEFDIGLRTLLARIKNPDAGLTLRSYGGQATASSAAPDAEADKAFDRNETTGWSATNSAGTAWLQYQFPGAAWVITQYKLVSAAGQPDADPRDWELLGSNDGRRWTLLDVRTHEEFTARGEAKRYVVPNRTAFLYYRLNITATASRGNGVHLAEFQLWSEDSPGIACASTQNPPDETAAMLFDGLPETKWFNADPESTGWVQYKFGNGAAWALSRYALTSGNDTPARDPQAWRFQASNDGATWITLDSRTNQAFASRLQTRSFSCVNSTPYRFYRLNILNSAEAGSGLQLADFDLGVTESAAKPAAILTDASPGGNSLANAFAFTTISSDTVAWGQGNRIWTMDKASETPVVLLDVKTVAPEATLTTFSYSKEIGQFLLSCMLSGKGALYSFKPEDSPVALHPIPVPSAAKNGVWLHDTNGSNWLAQSGGDYMLVQRNPGSEPVKFLRHANIQGFTVSGDGMRLFINGIVNDEASAGIWLYDIGSAQVRCVIPYGDHPSPYAVPQSFIERVLQLPSGERLNYNVFAPASISLHPHRKYPLVIGDTEFGVAVRGAHGRLWVPALVACDAYVVVVNRPDWWKDIEKWGDNVTAVYDEIVKTLPIDKSQVFLFSASAETRYTSEYMAKSPGLWKGAIYLNPTGLPDFSKWLSDQRKPRLLLTAGGLERQDGRLKTFREEALDHGILVDYIISAGESHHFVGNTAQLERTKAIVHFVFDE